MIQLKKVVDAAVAKCPSVKHVFVGTRTGTEVPMGAKDVHLDQVPSSTFSSARSDVQL